MNNKIEQLQKEIKEKQKIIKEIQEQCSHPKAATTKIAKADTGNWCKSDDSYWYEWYCSLCGKHWITPQDGYHNK